MKVILASGGLSLALLRLFSSESLSERMDSIFFGLLVLAVLILLIPWERIPWERIGSVKAAGVEVTLQAPQIEAALDSIQDNLKPLLEGLREDDSSESQREEKDSRLQELESSGPSFKEVLIAELKRLGPRLSRVNGGRLLWIDRRPRRVLFERRLLRGLGIDIVMTSDAEAAKALVATDNDFDMLVASIVDVVDGVIDLKGSADPHIRTLPVIFYSALSQEAAEKQAKLAMGLSPRPVVTVRLADFLPRLLRTIADARSTPLDLPGEKRVV